jgi:phosphomannomutase
MAFEIPRDLMVSVSGVRGRVGEALTPEIVTRFAAAFGAYLGEVAGGTPCAVIARDSRTSGPMFVRAATAGPNPPAVTSGRGARAHPTALFAVRYHKAHGGIVITASHNPVEWNALKLASASGMFLDADEAARMRSFLPDGAIRWASWDALGAVSIDTDAVARHLRAVLAIPFLDVPALRRRRFRVALDCVHGAGSTLLPPLLEQLGCEVIGIGLTPDGRFPREPEPVAANLGDLERLVLESKADIGIATDPDADRLSLVSSTGHAIGEDFTLALAQTRFETSTRTRGYQPLHQPVARGCGGGGRAAAAPGGRGRNQRCSQNAGGWGRHWWGGERRRDPA